MSMEEEHKTEAAAKHTPKVSVIMPVHNSSSFLLEALQSFQHQTYRSLELCAYDDCSMDDSLQKLRDFQAANTCTGREFRITTSSDLGHDCAKGSGFARNRAVDSSSGEILVFLDSDDVMMPDRIELQVEALGSNPTAIVGSRFTREPEDCTPYYTDWINNMTSKTLYLHQYRECTVILPTWAMRKEIFIQNGMFYQEKQKYPEDLDFFNKHLSNGGSLHKVDKELTMYRYHPNGISRQYPGRLLQQIRIPFLEARVLQHWDTFTIWGAGKDGRRFINDLSPSIASKVTAFCDVDDNKIGRDYYFIKLKKYIPVIHISAACPPFIICVGTKRYGGQIEKNIQSLGHEEGKDYFHFM